VLSWFPNGHAVKNWNADWKYMYFTNQQHSRTTNQILTEESNYIFTIIIEANTSSWERRLGKHLPIRPRLFYLLVYGFSPQDVSEVGKKTRKKTGLHDPKVQIVTIGNYCDLNMVVSRVQFLFVWRSCTTVYRFDEGLNTWQAQDYVSSSKTAEHFNRPRGIAD
jgi:hypothetical protein